MNWYERDPRQLLGDAGFRREMRGELALLFVNGAGIQEETIEIPTNFPALIEAYIEAARWYDGENRAAA